MGNCSVVNVLAPASYSDYPSIIMDRFNSCKGVLTLSDRGHFGSVTKVFKSFKPISVDNLFGGDIRVIFGEDWVDTFSKLTGDGFDFSVKSLIDKVLSEEKSKIGVADLSLIKEDFVNIDELYAILSDGTDETLKKLVIIYYLSFLNVISFPKDAKYIYILGNILNQVFQQDIITRELSVSKIYDFLTNTDYQVLVGNI